MSRVRRRLADSEAVGRLGSALPRPVERRLANTAFRRPHPRWGNLRRRRPFSERWGFDRGKPVDLHHVHRFLEQHAADVRGATLEVKDAAYTETYGRAVTSSDVLDVDPENPQATIVGDLSEPGSLPSEQFDCFILTETLQLVPDLDAAVANSWQALKPGGVLLVTVPTLSRIDPDSRDFDSWRLTPHGLRALVERQCPGAEIEVRGYGNLIVALAFLLGLCTDDLSADELDHVDPDFPVGAAARVAKPGSGQSPAG